MGPDKETLFTVFGCGVESLFLIVNRIDRKILYTADNAGGTGNFQRLNYMRNITEILTQRPG